MVVAVVNLLGNAREAEKAVHEIEAQVVGGEVGVGNVTRDHLAAGERAGQMGWPKADGLHLRRVVGLHPIGQRRAQIHQRVADGRQFPVQHAHHTEIVGRVEEDVIEPIIVVDERRTAFRRHVGFQPCDDVLEIRHVGGARIAVAPRPALHLPLDIAFRVAEIAEAEGAVIERVQAAVSVDEPLAQQADAFRRQVEAGRRFATQNQAVEPLHHIEGRAQHRGVVAIGQRPRHGESAVKGVEQHPLAVHVVAALGLLATRRAAEHHFSFTHAQQIGQVGVAGRELQDFQPALQARDGFLEVGFQAGEVEFLAGAGRADSVAHCSTFLPASMTSR